MSNVIELNLLQPLRRQKSGPAILLCGKSTKRVHHLKRQVDEMLPDDVSVVFVADIERTKRLILDREFALYIFVLSAEQRDMLELLSTMQSRDKAVTILLVDSASSNLIAIRRSFPDITVLDALEFDPGIIGELLLETGAGGLSHCCDLVDSSKPPNTLEHEDAVLSAVHAKALLAKLDHRLRLADGEFDSGQLVEGQAHLIAAIQHVGTIAATLQGLEQILRTHPIYSSVEGTNGALLEKAQPAATDCTQGGTHFQI